MTIALKHNKFMGFYLKGEEKTAGTVDNPPGIDLLLFPSAGL